MLTRGNRHTRALGVVVAAVALAGCGGGDDGPMPAADVETKLVELIEDRGAADNAAADCARETDTRYRCSVATETFDGATGRGEGLGDDTYEISVIVDPDTGELKVD